MAVASAASSKISLSAKPSPSPFKCRPPMNPHFTLRFAMNPQNLTRLSLSCSSAEAQTSSGPDEPCNGEVVLKEALKRVGIHIGLSNTRFGAYEVRKSGEILMEVFKREGYIYFVPTRFAPIAPGRGDPDKFAESLKRGGFHTVCMHDRFGSSEPRRDILTEALERHGINIVFVPAWSPP